MQTKMQWTFESKITLNEVTKSINSQTNNKALGNDGLTAEFHKHFSNEPSLILLDVYDIWEKLGCYFYCKNHNCLYKFRL